MLIVLSIQLVRRHGGEVPVDIFGVNEETPIPGPSDTEDKGNLTP